MDGGVRIGSASICLVLRDCAIKRRLIRAKLQGDIGEERVFSGHVELTETVKDLARQGKFSCFSAPGQKSRTFVDEVGGCHFARCQGPTDFRDPGQQVGKKARASHFRFVFWFFGTNGFEV